MCTIRERMWYELKDAPRNHYNWIVVKLQSLRLWFWRKFGKIYATGCGHKTRLVTEIDLFNKPYVISLKKSELAYCPKCIKELIVPCACCHRPIFPGDAVSIWEPDQIHYQIPKGTIVAGSNPLRLIKCQKGICSQTREKKAGWWTGNGVFYTLNNVPLLELTITK